LMVLLPWFFVLINPLINYYKEKTIHQVVKKTLRKIINISLLNG
jgi:hypothetical protein